jgi:acyl carrier protein
MRKIVLLLTVILFSSKITAQELRPEVKMITDSIAGDRNIIPFFVGYLPTEERRLSGKINRLARTANSKELLALLAGNKATLKAAAFQALCIQDSVDIIPLVIHHLYDTDSIKLYAGCFVSYLMTGDYFIDIFQQYFYKKTAEDVQIIEQFRDAQKIDSLIMYDPVIKLQYKTDKIMRLTAADTQYYARIKQMAQYEPIPQAIIALARYKKQEDKAIFAGFLNEEKKQYHAIWAVREFPDSFFYPLLVRIFEKEYRKKRYSYVTCRILFQALAQYPNEQTTAVFERILQDKKERRREVLGKLLMVAIRKYPHPLFERFQGVITVDGPNTYFYENEASAER